jgi:glyoxylase-like metal-dependent hydrolase (beta-lactamase superfamily II)
MRLYAFHCGSERGPMAAFDPFDADPGATIEIPYFFFLIQHPHGNVLFDTGAHPSLATNPRERLGDAADDWEIVMRPEDGIVDRLATLGLRPENVSLVIQSHLHYDHAGGIEFFPHAPVLIHSDELPFALDPPIYQAGVYARADFAMPRVRWQEVDGEHDVFGDGKLVIFPTPGHTKGHQSLLVRLEDRPVMLLSDAAYLVEKMRARALPAGSMVWSSEEMVASWERIEVMEREFGAELIPTHDLSYRSRTRLAPEAWYD